MNRSTPLAALAAVFAAVCTAAAGSAPVVATIPPLSESADPDRTFADIPLAAPAAAPAAPDACAASPAPVAPEVAAVAAATARTEVIVETVEKIVEAVTEQIVITPGLTHGDGNVRIVLKPTVLDGSEISMTAKDGALSVAIVPATPDAGRLAAAALPRLEAALAEHVPAFRHIAVAVMSKKGKSDETA